MGLDIVSQVNLQGFFDISADQIKGFDGKEARLMAKIDHSESLPPVMRQNHLSILAIENGLYRISKANPFIKIGEGGTAKITTITAPKHLLTLDPYRIATESAALDLAHHSGILANVFGEETKLTIRGRTRGDLNFALDNIHFNISGVQIEIDGGYEGASTVNLVEAKNRSCSDLNIRQLLYPELHWRAKIGTAKIVRSWAMFLEVDIFRFLPFKSVDNNFSFDFKNEKAFRFEKAGLFNLLAIKLNPKYQDQDAPFPQADTFSNVMTLLTTLRTESNMEKAAIAEYFAFDARQASYYTSALKWLGLATSDPTVSLTSTGMEISNAPVDEQLRRIANILFSHPVFFHALRAGAESVPDSLFNNGNNTLSSKTINRRKKTVTAWIKFFQYRFQNAT